MLSEASFTAWARRLGLSAEAVQEIRLVRNTRPNRRVRSGASNVIARFPSVKIGRVIQAESHAVELPFVYAAERDPDVLELWDQPRQGWRMPLRYVAKSGRAVVAHHTPDLDLTRFRGHSPAWGCVTGEGGPYAEKSRARSAAVSCRGDSSRTEQR